MRPTVSVLVPAYNSADFVREAITSALEQHDVPLEVIVVDDGSSDGTAEVVTGMSDPRVRLLQQENGGVAVARNRAAAAARGEFLALLDADDVWLPHKLATQLRRLEDDPDVGAVGSLMYHIDPESRVLGVTAPLLLTRRSHRRVRTGELNPFPISSVVLRREVFERVGGFDESLRQHVPAMVEDADLLSKVARCSRLVGIHQPLGGYRIHRSAATATGFRNQRQGLRFLVARQRASARGATLTWEDFVTSDQPTLRERIAEWSALRYRLAGQALADGEHVRAAALGLASLALDPRGLMRLVGQQWWRVTGRMPRTLRE